MTKDDIERIWQQEHDDASRRDGLKMAVAIAAVVWVGIALLAWWVR